MRSFSCVSACGSAHLRIHSPQAALASSYQTLMTTASPALCSMTGFASASQDLGPFSLNLELRAVNHRYLDLQFKLPEEFRQNEPALREQLTGSVQRGKVECRVQLARNEAAT